MSLGLIGRKLRMTRIFSDQGESLSVTAIQAGPCPIVSVKDGNGDGEKVLQLGYGELKEDKVTKPQAGHFKKAKVAPCRILKEFRVAGSEKADELKAGGTVTVEMFNEGERVNIRARSKGKGFMGVVKRHGFRTREKTHGQSDRLRAPGSIGQSSYPSRVWKGMKMAGKTGDRWTTTRNLEVVKVLKEENVILVKGAVPGTSNNHLIIKKLS